MIFRHNNCLCRICKFNTFLFKYFMNRIVGCPLVKLTHITVTEYKNKMNEERNTSWRAAKVKKKKP